MHFKVDAQNLIKSKPYVKKAIGSRNITALQKGFKLCNKFKVFSNWKNLPRSAERLNHKFG